MINKTIGQRFLVYGLAALALTIAYPLSAAQEKVARITEYPVPTGSHPHDVAPAPGGGPENRDGRHRPFINGDMIKRALVDVADRIKLVLDPNTQLCRVDARKLCVEFACR